MLEFGFYNVDCMIGMAEFPDKFFDLAIVDPPYGIGEDGKKNHSRGKLTIATQYKPKNWDREIPNNKYFNELFRTSKNQIIWGGNFFGDYLKSTSCWLVWDKINGKSCFADCELAWTSFKSSIRLFRWKWAGCFQQNMKNKEIRIHPTQKPIALYRWLLQNYAKPGDKILDTHVGSASSLIACETEGFNDYVGFELDKDYYRDAKDRLETWRKNRHPELFEVSEYRQAANWG